MTIRVLPPPSGKQPDITVNGRKYSCAVGATLDVPDHDALVMLANGWTAAAAAAGKVGTTANRPINPPAGTDYLDTTLGYAIKFDGMLWRNPASGAGV